MAPINCDCSGASAGLHIPGCHGAGIGDLTSNDKGTGARFNAGKVPYELMPIAQMAFALHPDEGHQTYVRQALVALGEFQAGGGEKQLFDVLRYAGMAAGMAPMEVMAETARVLEYGAKKYDAWNWAKGMSWQSVIACMARHLLGTPDWPGMWQEPRGADRDSGRQHIGHVGCNVMFLLQYMATYPDGDDRPQHLIEKPF